MERARRSVQTMTEFVERVIRHLVVDVGVTQFVKLGTPVPAGPDVHEIAQAAARGTRIVYVGDDPTVLAHAHSLRSSSPEGITDYVHGSLLDLGPIIEQTGATLDLDRPVAFVAPATMNFVVDEDDPYGVVARIARFFTGLDLIEPGLVLVEQWRPSPRHRARPQRPAHPHVRRPRRQAKPIRLITSHGMRSIGIRPVGVVEVEQGAGHRSNSTMASLATGRCRGAHLLR
jgi:hypothetical protein